MKKVNLFWLVMILVMIMPLSAAGDSLSGEGKIFAANYPLAYFAKRISGEPDTVFFPETEDSPAFWKPSINDILTIQKAGVILLNGATYEKWAKGVSLPMWRVVDTSAGFRDQYMTLEETVTHSHGPEGEHSHANVVFTTWLDFSQAAEQAKAVKDALVAARLGTEEELTKNCEALRQDLLALDDAIAQITKDHKDMPIFGSRPHYDYFARRYQLNIETVFLEPDTFASNPVMWEALEYFRREHPAKLIIWERPPSPEAVKALEERGMGRVVLNPCGGRPEHGDFLTVMQQNVENLRLALE
jgi:zinc transport system substrate-binding protein